MAARNPRDVHTLTAAGVNAGDLDAILELYEAEAKMVPEAGKDPVMGPAAIRELFQGFLALNPTITVDTAGVIESGDLALLYSKWHLTGTGPDGEPVEVSGNGIEVVRRQSDGSWRYVIDDPSGAD